MKYLENSDLAALTALLSHDSLGAEKQRAIYGRIEAFTFKRAGSDKKTAAVLGSKYVEELQEIQSQGLHALILGRKRSQSAGLLQDALRNPKKQRGRSSSFDVVDNRKVLRTVPLGQLSGLGDFAEQATRRLMTDLVLTMNLTFPDYDFSSIKATDFKRIHMGQVISHVNERLSELTQTNPQLLSNLWTQLDGVIDLQHVDVYSYQPAEESDTTAFLKNSLVPDSDPDSATTTSLWSFNYFFVNKRDRRLVFFPCIEVVRIVDETEVEQEGFIQAGETLEADFDLDPASSMAGGIPISTN